MSDGATIKKLLDRFGTTFAEEHGIRIADGTPSPLFQLLVFCLLSSNRVNHGIASTAFAALKKEGWITAEGMSGSSWQDRVNALHRGRYGEYQEQYAGYLGDAAEHCVKTYGGDLRLLREEAGREPNAERERLKGFKGIGDVGVDLFFREVQVAWEEHRGFLDGKAEKAADRLGLDSAGLADRVSEDDLPRLISALVRCDLEDGYEEVMG